MKKILILLLVVVMTISLTACGGGTESTETGGDDKEVSTCTFHGLPRRSKYLSCSVVH